MSSSAVRPSRTTSSTRVQTDPDNTRLPRSICSETTACSRVGLPPTSWCSWLASPLEPLETLVRDLRERFDGVVLLNDGFGDVTTLESVEKLLETGLADAVDAEAAPSGSVVEIDRKIEVRRDLPSPPPPDLDRQVATPDPDGVWGDVNPQNLIGKHPRRPRRDPLATPRRCGHNVKKRRGAARQGPAGRP